MTLEAAPQVLEVGGRAVPITVCRSVRARRLQLRVCPVSGGVRLTLPLGCSEAEARAFLRARQDWIRDTLDRLAATGPAVPPRPFGFGVEVPVAGMPLRIVEGAGRTVRQQGGLLLVPGPGERVNARVGAWLRAEAGRRLEAETRALAATIGRPVARVSVRDPTSRWGSCSAAGAIAYSWRLLLAPEFVRRAVVAHEVAHLAEPNHGPRFWALAEALLGASHAPARRWLAAHGPALHAWGRSG